MEKRLGVLSNKQLMAWIGWNVRVPRTTFMLDKQAQLSSQEVSYDRIFVDGSRHQIHLRITISRVTPITRERQHGFSKERRTRSGSQQAQSRYSGFMGNVCPCPILPPDVPNNIPYLQLAPARAYFGS